MAGRIATLIAGFALGLAACSTALPSTRSSTVISNEDIKAILSERIDFYQSGVGMVVGVIDPSGRRIVAHGVADKTTNRPVDGDMIFDLASTTKGFTALLLADMVERGEVKLSDPAANYLPASIAMPVGANGRQITLIDLATFYSGLPRDLEPFGRDTRNPFADYSMDQLEAFMAATNIKHEIGSRFGYSNLGYNLLGQALSQRAGLSYEQLLKQRILDPLGMESTMVISDQNPPLALKERLAGGHNAALAPTPHADHAEGFKAAGALSSSANDLLDFLEAMTGLKETSLGPAFRKLLITQRPTDRADTLVGLGWGITYRNERKIIWRTGGHAGFNSWIGYDPESQTGVVVLSNSAAADSEDIGFHLLDPHSPLHRLQKQIHLDQARLDVLAGRYRLPDGKIITIVREDDHLSWMLEGFQFNAAYPLSDRAFATRAFVGEFTFDFETEDQLHPQRVVFYPPAADPPFEIAVRIE